MGSNIIALGSCTGAQCGSRPTVWGRGILLGHAENDAVVTFSIVAIIATCGHNPQHEYIGFKNWSHGDAPFVNGFKGFVTIFVSSSFSYCGTETVTMTGGESKNLVRNTPKIIKTVLENFIFLRPHYVLCGYLMFPMITLI